MHAKQAGEACLSKCFHFLGCRVTEQPDQGHSGESQEFVNLSAAVALAQQQISQAGDNYDKALRGGSAAGTARCIPAWRQPAAQRCDCSNLSSGLCNTLNFLSDAVGTSDGQPWCRVSGWCCNS